ncbi:hypothetical protein MNBD_IGNAVI01-883 [hydrothermal vent metagenome]|uniref:Lipoprotein n=1 Tax=hydrothermal vent metagenome TaxID=652676 RepID=A0A3B1BIP4_9ZZZZ
MKYKSFSDRHCNKLMKPFFSIIFILLFSLSCSSSEQNLQVSGFRFTYDGNKYFIRSINNCPDNTQSCNYLIAQNFKAVDLNQDRVIDKIIRGDVTIHEAQKIYSYALNLLEKQNKLSVMNKEDEKFQYTITRPYIVFQITSFQTGKDNLFNQFRIVQKRGDSKQDISLFNDLKADGNLDERLKGNFSIDNAQKYYKETIDEGVRANRIIAADSLIRVK